MYESGFQLKRPLSVASIESAIEYLRYGMPQIKPDIFQQKVLDAIENEPDEKLRSVYFVAAKTCVPRDLKELVIASRHRATVRWAALEAAQTDTTE